MEELGNFVFFRITYDFIHSEIDEFAIQLLARTMALVSAAALSVLTLWILVRGYRIVTGQSHQSMLGLVVDALRTTLILGFACGMALSGSTLYEFLGSDLPNEIARVVTGSNEPVIEQVDRSLAVMQVALTSLDSLDVAHDPIANKAKARAMWFTGIGTAGPALSGGAMLLMNQIALALFIGLGPLFVLSLLFEQTKGLFGKWLYYGIGTMFSLAVLSVMVTLALDMVLAVGAAFWLSGSLGANGEGITSLAMQQGGLGLILTLLILSAPPMAAQFFNGLLGSFSPFSAFGGGGRQHVPPHESATSFATGTDPYGATSVSMHTVHHYGASTVPFRDEIRPHASAQEAQHGNQALTGPPDDFLERYPNALVSNASIGAGNPLPLDVWVRAQAGTGLQEGKIYGVEPAQIAGLLESQELARQKHRAGQLSDSDYASARNAVSLGYHAEVNLGARTYATSVVNDPALSMQEKYDRLYGMGAHAGELGHRMGIDYVKGGPQGGRADEIGKKYMQDYNLYNPREPVTLFVDKSVDAGPHLRNLLGVSKDADIGSMTFNHDPKEVYSSSGQFAIRNEDHLKHNDLVGQIVLKQSTLDTLPGAVAKHTFESVDNFAHGGGRGKKWENQTQQDAQDFATKESKTRAGREIVTAVAGVGWDAHKAAKEPYMTIDVFASKKEPSKRSFEVRINVFDARINDFVERPPLINEDMYMEIIRAQKN